MSKKKMRPAPLKSTFLEIKLFSYSLSLSEYEDEDIEYED